MAASESETVGFIDVGTNSIHLLVVRFYKDSAGTPVFQDKETVRLGQSLYSTGRIDEETIRKSALVVSRFTQISKDLGADKVVAFATCAAREAANRDELIQALSSNAEVEVKVIPGTEEARLIALGVFGDKGPAERTIEIDIGGGSTEVIIREGGENLFLDSLSMGAVRYAYGLKINNKAPVSEDDYNFMMRNVDISSYHAVNRIKDIGFTKAMGSSGTLIALAEMCAARRGDHDSSYLTLRELRELMPEVRSRDMVGRYTIPGLGKGRADIIVAGGAIAEELMSQFGIERMDISQKGLKQGMQLDHMLTHGYTIFGIRESSIRALAHRCQYDEAHAETVSRNAVSLFDQARGLGLNLMSDGYRNLLYCAALLHDIGEMISYTKPQRALAGDHRERGPRRFQHRRDQGDGTDGEVPPQEVPWFQGSPAVMFVSRGRPGRKAVRHVPQDSGCGGQAQEPRRIGHPSGQEGEHRAGGARLRRRHQHGALEPGEGPSGLQEAVRSGYAASPLRRHRHRVRW